MESCFNKLTNKQPNIVEILIPTLTDYITTISTIADWPYDHM